MTGNTIWSTLGIEQTTDTTAIRRAYAARLKLTNPEDDAEAFQVLRKAYDQALARAGGRGGRTVRIVASSSPGPMPESGPQAQSEPEPAPSIKPRPAPEPQMVDPARLAMQAEAQAVRQQTAELSAALKHLVALARARPVDDDALAAALAAVLGSPALDSISAYNDAEARVADLILRNAPFADRLIERAVSHFGWDTGRSGIAAHAGKAIVGRWATLKYWDRLVKPASALHSAYLALTRKPDRRRQYAYRLSLSLTREVGELLSIAQHDHSALLERFDPDALAWWRKRLSEPRLPPGVFLTILFAPPVIAFFSAVEWTKGRDAIGLWPLCLAIYTSSVAAASGLAAGWLYGVAKPQARWQAEWRFSAPQWLALGWAPTMVGLLLIAALLPPTLIGGLLLSALGALTFAWAVITGQPDKRPGTSVSWQVRAGVLLIFPAMFWFAAAPSMGGHAFLQSGGVVVWAFAAEMTGLASLWTYWRTTLSPQARRIGLYSLGAAVAAMPVLIWLTSDNPRSAPIETALVAALVFAERAINAYSTSTPGSLFTIRARVLQLSWIFWSVVLAIASAGYGQGDAGLLFGAVWILSGAGLGVVGALQIERAERFQRRQQAA